MISAEITPPDRSDGACDRRAYRAFISYSHTDETEARRLHRWLESYRIPSRLVGHVSHLGSVPRRLTPIFRDRAELPAASSLDDEVRKAMASSEALIVLCSPAAKASRWVSAEIALFRDLHPDRPIVAALLIGEPADSFPAPLSERNGLSASGEPIAADFRRNRDGPRLARLKIVAALTGVALDRIIQRDAQRQLRRVIAITISALVLMLCLLLMLSFAIRSRIEADRQRQQAEGLIDFMLTDLRQKLKGAGKLGILRTVNEQALAYYAGQSNLNALPADSLERRARVLHAMGEDDHERGEAASALAKFREADRVTAALLAAAPNDPPRLFAHAQSEYWLGYVDFIRYRYDTALPRFTAYRRLASRLVQLEPGNLGYRKELAYAQGNICAIAVARHGPAAQLDECRNALTTMARIGAAAPADAGIAEDLANRHAWMGDALVVEGRRAEALRERTMQAAIIEALLKGAPGNARYLEDRMLARYSTSELLYSLGERDRAKSMRDDARQDAVDLIASDPENNDWRIWRKKLDQPLGQ